MIAPSHARPSTVVTASFRRHSSSSNAQRRRHGGTRHAARAAGTAARRRRVPVQSPLARDIPHVLCHAAAGGGDGAAAAGTGTTVVTEYVVLLTARPDASPEEEQAALDAAWSLQFMAPAVMCASVGAVKSQRSYQADGGSSSSSSSSISGTADGERVGDDRGGFTHFVHFRLANRAALAALQRHPLHAALLRDVLAPLSREPPAELAFEARLPRELEGLFRRADEYGEGTELLLLLGPAQGGAGTGADDFLSRLAAFAESSVAGALQASAGAFIAAGSGGGCADSRAWPGPAAPTHALMARFPGPRQAGAFLASAPCAAAAAGDPRLPLRAVAAVSASIEAGKEGQSRRQAL